MECRILPIFSLFILLLIKAKTQELSSDSDQFSNVEFPRPKPLERLESYDNNHKPKFVDCDKITASVLEEQQKGVRVTKVVAEDEDPIDNGGTVHYKIVQRDDNRAYFTINNITGEVFTKETFDRDEPTRQKELYVTVQATDNGKPPLSDLCTFKVTIEDINDNAPSFDKSEYEEHVAEDLKVGSEVVRIFAYDIDDGINSKLSYSLVPNEKFDQYFRINKDTGVVHLMKSLARQVDFLFTSSVVVKDKGGLDTNDTHSSNADLKIKVVDSNTKAPRIIDYPKSIELLENFSKFDEPLITINAESNIDNEDIIYELVKGKTAQTNKDQTFILRQSKSNGSATIYLVRHLDYETVTSYQLTVRVRNTDSLATSVNIQVNILDVNDEIPTFIELLKGSVVENDNIGAQAMQVRAIDKDGTSANNIVRYKLVDHEDLFSIDPESGIITAKQVFDREETAVYSVTVRAYDNSPSAILHTGEPNTAEQKFHITIEDRNDNEPNFAKTEYIVHNISESADVSSFVVEVEAKDKDAASELHYSILEGNTGGAFSIEESTGRIKVNKKLDFEKIESYNLTVIADDGIYNDTAKVLISIQNENDELPIFESYNKTITLEEERVYEDCIIMLKAYDPDIKDRTADQKIIYIIQKSTDKNTFLNVTRFPNGTGCVYMIKALNRDRPDGYLNYQFFVLAYDNYGGPNTQSAYAELNIILLDINDNAPFLNVTEVVWNENRDPGFVTTLTADDYDDSQQNGPPFTFTMVSIDGNSNTELFSVQPNGDLFANVIFDREEKKYYDIAINIKDSGIPTMSAISTLRVIIGDENDNAAENGASEIFVYKFEKMKSDIEIGRVYVKDPDDWDLNDKVFQFEVYHDYFYLNESNNGMIVMRNNAKEGDYYLDFRVVEESPYVLRHEVQATVNVTVKSIPEEAVIKSGSIRIKGSSIENFVEKQNGGLSKKDVLQKQIAQIVNTSISNVDVFTIIPTPSNSSYIDVRFSAHGSPYYAPERLNTKATEFEDKLEASLGVEFVMIGISECLDESACGFGSSCSNHLIIRDEPAVVLTNKTSFVGVKAMVERSCDCARRVVKECFNGGTPLEDGTCSCAEEFEGEHCEIYGIGFSGNGWAMYPTFDACNETVITFSVLANSPDGMVFYVGPENYEQAIKLSKDLMALEIRDGFLVLKLDFGYGSREVVSTSKKINDGAMHKVRIRYTHEDVQLIIDECLSCLEWVATKGILNVNGPLQLGGMKRYFPEEHSKILWGNFTLSKQGFDGCIRNFTVNDYHYNLGMPSDSYNPSINCLYGLTGAATFGIDSNFLVAILVCIAILIILLLAVVVHRRKQDNLNEKDVDDIRENIINYEDEGGGEYDANFDLTPLRTNHEEKMPIKYKPTGEIPADINSFLETKKDDCDKDQDNLPYDDVRHYAYEGDGNSTGSLSSLASCTDEGDLTFNYLSDFGPRFRKLADMYGEDPSDESSQEGGEESYC